MQIESTFPSKNKISKLIKISIDIFSIHAIILALRVTRTKIEQVGGIPEWPKGTDCKSAAYRFGGSNPPSPTKTCGLNDCTPKTARVSSGFRVFIAKIIARFSWMQNINMRDTNDRKAD